MRAHHIAIHKMTGRHVIFELLPRHKVLKHYPPVKGACILQGNALDLQNLSLPEGAAALQSDKCR